mmetsp:Transcript_84656/g.236260  ORF Transcript_84656/g.236260 Transcript_84656/m.236260 type:complete len:94 (+) Transcript_84656:474-755(+)
MVVVVAVEDVVLDVKVVWVDVVTVAVVVLLDVQGDVVADVELVLVEVVVVDVTSVFVVVGNVPKGGLVGQIASPGNSCPVGWEITGGTVVCGM